MSFCNCSSRFNCTYAAVVASIAVGVITAFLTIMGVIALTPAFLWVTLGVAAVYLAVVLIATAIAHCCHIEHCSALSALLIGILGTVLFSIILLAVTFAATSVIGAIFAGVLLFFLSLTFTATACYVRCLAKSRYN